MTNYNVDNLIHVMKYRHEERKDVWGLPDEVLEGAIEYVKSTRYGGVDGIEAYDSLAIDAEILEKGVDDDDLAPGEALFETEHYWIVSW